ncbi:hypothetical protein [Microcoleus sp.]|uniref:hypothetical protein n=1 Tax=Microcoleus sp. TaxID=44472 RepID=UPI00352376A2
MPPLLSKTTDQRIVHHGMWERFKFIQKGFEGSPGVRLFYYDGTIEILMPGEDHEAFAHVIGYLLTTFLVEQGIFFKPTGAMTQERSGVVSVQADESYCIGSVKQIPDLSIEVVFTSGGISKLERYRTHLTSFRDRLTALDRPKSSFLRSFGLNERLGRFSSWLSPLT